MNNEPVAWIKQNPETLEAELHFDKLAKYWATVISNPDIPLYTHPAKPIDKPDECISGCPENQTCDYCAGIKTLTDEEIKQIFKEQTGFFFDDNPADDLALMDFAKAILRKAQEK